MVRAGKPIDISGSNDLLRLVEDMRASQEPRVLRRDGEDVAILIPLGTTPERRSRREKTEADYEAFLAAAGSWHDVDTDKLIEVIYESRQRSSRPPIEL